MQENEKGGMIPQKTVEAEGQPKSSKPMFRRKAIVSGVQGVASYGGKPTSAKNNQQATPQRQVEPQTKNQTQKVLVREAQPREVVGARSVKASVNTKAKAEVKITYLGGVGEIGKNMTAIEQGNEIIVVDCGVMFPSEDMPGIDLVIPDYTYLKDNASKVKAFVITHGHEDHIGAIPYVLKDFPNAVIYASKLTCALIENKCREHNLKTLKLQVANSRKEYKIGSFVVEFVDVNHSIADAFALKIKTRAGVIFHTGDFKIDFRPIDGKMIDLTRIAEIGEEGVDLLMCESTNVERSGYTISESEVGENIEKLRST